MQLKFIKLTRYHDGNPVYINAEHIQSLVVAIGEDVYQGSVRTLLSTEDGMEWSVKETPAQIVLLCAAGCVELVDDAAVELVPRLR